VDQAVVQQEILDQVIIVEQETLHQLVHPKGLKVVNLLLIVPLLQVEAVELLQREHKVQLVIVRDQVLLVLLDREEMVQQVQLQDLQ
tara:strand:- start:203 stop:463 length:261 start_codon:yes stop_codon:yes gene_type:complete